MANTKEAGWWQSTWNWWKTAKTIVGSLWRWGVGGVCGLVSLQVLLHAGHNRSQRLKSYVGNWANRSCFWMVVDQKKSAVGGVVLATGEKSWLGCWCEGVWLLKDLKHNGPKNLYCVLVHHKLMYVSKETKKKTLWYILIHFNKHKNFRTMNTIDLEYADSVARLNPPQKRSTSG